MRKVPVDMQTLSLALENQGGENQWYLDLETGDVIPVFDDPESEEMVENDPDRFLFIEVSADSRDEFRVMEDFVSGLPDGEAKRDLERVLQRSKPFRNFREALRDWPDLREQWFAVQNRRGEQAVRDWLAEHEIKPVPRGPIP
ncbi:MAG TPA: UPF0158 family protein [Opitutus sp.]|nr:UPF0158 family protein [Opitutus sp.]